MILIKSLNHYNPTLTMATTNEATAVLNNCNFSQTLNAYYLAEIHNYKDSPQDLETVIDAMKLSTRACKNANEIYKY